MLDNYDLWVRHETEQEKELEKYPVCSECDNHITDDYFYLINDEVICEECLDNNYRKRVDDYIE